MRKRPVGPVRIAGGEPENVKKSFVLFEEASRGSAALTGRYDIKL